MGHLRQTLDILLANDDPKTGYADLCANIETQQAKLTKLAALRLQLEAKLLRTLAVAVHKARPDCDLFITGQTCRIRSGSTYVECQLNGGKWVIADAVMTPDADSINEAVQIIDATIPVKPGTGKIVLEGHGALSLSALVEYNNSLPTRLRRS